MRHRQFRRRLLVPHLAVDAHGPGAGVQAGGEAGGVAVLQRIGALPRIAVEAGLGAGLSLSSEADDVDLDDFDIDRFRSVDAMAAFLAEVNQLHAQVRDALAQQQ